MTSNAMTASSMAQTLSGILATESSLTPISYSSPQNCVELPPDNAPPPDPDENTLSDEGGVELVLEVQSSSAGPPMGPVMWEEKGRMKKQMTHTETPNWKVRR